MCKRLLKYLLASSSIVFVSSCNRGNPQNSVKGPKTDVNEHVIVEKTALHHAAEKGELERVETLINNPNINLNSQDSYGDTALHYAARKGHLEIIKILGKCEENIHIKIGNNKGATPLHTAAEEGQLGIVKYLLEKGSEERTREVRNENGENYKEKYMHLKWKFDENQKDDDGRTVLHYAARKNQLKVIKYLVEERNADKKVKDRLGKTALQYATQQGVKSCLK